MKPVNRQTCKPVNRASVCGKIILSGEYAVVFGLPGIAVSSKEKINIKYEETPTGRIIIRWPEASKMWLDYADRIIKLIEDRRPATANGYVLDIESDLPLGKGMGSSTALVIALCRCLLGQDCMKEALEIENAVNPGNSGIDFAVIWEEKPILFQRTQDSGFQLSIFNCQFSIDQWRLIDTGSPNETTPELVAWIKSREKECLPALETIGRCTERLLAGEPLKQVMRDHHRAQVALGVVTPNAQKIIAEIEAKGGSAKVIGAGGRTGGSGIVLAID